jgi:membrane-bound ClpP family serine protease
VIQATRKVISFGGISCTLFGTRGFIVKNSNNAILFTAIVVFLAMTIALVIGCSRDGAAKAAVATTAAPQGNAPASEPTPPTGKTAVGTVAETMDAAGYTYVKVKTASGEIWAAASQFKVKAGDKVIVPIEMPMENFHSNTLKRTFSVIYFTPKVFFQGEAGAPAVTQ